MNSFAFLGMFLFFLQRLLDVLKFAVFARVIFSWFSMHGIQENRIYMFFVDVTEPLFRLVKKLPHRIGMMDISALYVFILLDVMSQVLSYVAASIFY